MAISTILSILFIHWVADFILQSDWQAQNKSKNWKALMAHVTTYGLVWLLVMPIVFKCSLDISMSAALGRAVIFAWVTLIAHYITDHFTSRLNSKLWDEEKVHWFFVSVGFDQWLHYVQLFLTFHYLS